VAYVRQSKASVVLISQGSCSGTNRPQE